MFLLNTKIYTRNYIIKPNKKCYPWIAFFVVISRIFINELQFVKWIVFRSKMIKKYTKTNVRKIKHR